MRGLRLEIEYRAKASEVELVELPTPSESQPAPRPAPSPGFRWLLRQEVAAHGLIVEAVQPQRQEPPVGERRVVDALEPFDVLTGNIQPVIQSDRRWWLGGLGAEYGWLTRNATSESFGEERTQMAPTKSPSSRVRRVEGGAAENATHRQIRKLMQRLLSQSRIESRAMAMRLFQKTFGMTLVTCLTQHRVSHAQHLLVTTNQTATDIALQSGFQSLSRFNDAFRRACGCSPTPPPTTPPH